MIEYYVKIIITIRIIIQCKFCLNQLSSYSSHFYSAVWDKSCTFTSQANPPQHSSRQSSHQLDLPLVRDNLTVV